MTDPTIRAALEAAGEAARDVLAQDGTCPSLGGFVCTSPPCRCARDASAAAVAAFHRKRAVDCRSVGLIPSAIAHDDLAAAVEQAAKEGEP